MHVQVDIVIESMAPVGSGVWTGHEEEGHDDASHLGDFGEATQAQI